jgi:hypothetical protein
VLLRSLDQPNEKLVELLLAARTARSLGVRHLTLVAPYLAYMRQDMAFLPAKPSASASSAVSGQPVRREWSRWTRTCTAWPRWPKRFQPARPSS